MTRPLKTTPILLISALLLSLSTLVPATAQIGVPIPFGANKPAIEWFHITTEHFKIVYHEGLEEVALEAAAVAEAIYPVVTGNLEEELPGRTPIYLSDLDDITNAIALGDEYIFIWMRGITADGRYGGIRAAGRSKWLRTVITHEFTHIVVDAAASFFNLNGFLPPSVPRWFNEGTARAMEPDGWTSDVDQVLRMATDVGELEYDGSDPLDGHLLYEGGQSLVRYMMQEYGNDVIADILHGGRSFTGYDFGQAVFEATDVRFDQIYDAWQDELKEHYKTELQRGDRIDQIGRRLEIDNLTAIAWAVPSKDGSAIAYSGSNGVRDNGIYVGTKDGTELEKITGERGLEPVFDWAPDGRSLVVSKGRYASDRTLTHDLYRLSLDGDLDRITSGEDLTDPAWSPDGKMIVAVQSRAGKGNLVRVDPNTGRVSPLTTFSADAQAYTPRFSPDGHSLAVSYFDGDGSRVIATINLVDTSGAKLIDRVRDSANNRYPLWSPDGKTLAYTSHAGGVPNIRTVELATGEINQVTQLVDGAYGTGWINGIDSILVISIEGPGDITPWLVAREKGDPSTAPVPDTDPWQTVAFDRVTPDPSDIKPASILSQGPYNSIDGIHPIVPFFPVLTSDIPVLNPSSFPINARIGVFSMWWDPMQKHQLLGFADYGFASGLIGGDIFYVNNTLPFSIATHADWSVGLEGVLPGSAGIRDVLYFQRSSGGDVTLAYWLPGTDALDVFHEFRVTAGASTRRPVGIDSARAADVLGVEHTRTWVGLGYTWSTPNIVADGGYEKGLGIAGGSFEFDKLDAHLSTKIPLVGPFSLIATGHAVAQWGEQIPYEFVGLHRYDLLSTDVGVSLRTLTDYTIRVRGVDEWIFGDRAWTASAGLELNFNWINFLAPYRIGLMVFAEQGSAWFDDDPNPDTPKAFGYGGELRMPYLENLHLALGLAEGSIDDTSLGLEFYTRVGWGF